MTRAPAPLDTDKYEPDEDGLPRELVGTWTKDKYARLSKYIDISRAVRRGFIGDTKGGATYIELFCGPGRVRIRDTSEVTHGSPLVAWAEASGSNTPFTEMHIADADPRLLEATTIRLRKKGALVFAHCGPAIETVDRVIPKLNPYGLHVAFLDPYNLAALPFEVIRKLAGLKRMDILIHVSLQDFNRNFLRYLEAEKSPLDSFAPDWRKHVQGDRSLEYVRGKLFAYWRSLLGTIGMSTAEAAELIVGPANQPLYWLAFAARHERALEFWEKIRNIEPDPQEKLF